MPTQPTVIEPRLEIEPLNESGDIGGSVEFSCVFSGCPSPNVTWFHNNTVLSPGGRVEYDIYTQHRITICFLTIHNVSEADRGLYKCVGGNPGGIVSSSPVDLTLNSDVQIVKKRSADSSLSLCKQISDPESGETKN